IGVNVAANETAVRNSNPSLTDTIAEATGATITDLDSAWIALLNQPTVTEMAQLPRGSALVPELGARVAIAVDGLWLEPAASSTELVLTGPGIPGRRTLYTSGVNPDVLAGLGRSSGEFPAGLDVWLFSPDGQVAAIPRSTTLTIGQEN
ncbi:MAG: phosphonate C-P lyase system protein PhnH, partial [Actinomycetota bacterium]|nr:phosphonate C-P lyase system protein PhnH [Actinomycetota bacterium]